MIDRAIALIMPAFAAFRVKVQGPDRSIVDWHDLSQHSGDNLSGLAAELFQLDIARIRGLEAKLAAQLGFLTPLIPLVTALGALALREQHVASAIVTFLAAAHLLVTYLVAHSAYQATPFYMPLPAHVETSLQDDPSGASLERDLAVRQIWSVESNQPRSIRLSNLIWAASRSLQYAVVLLAVAGLMTLTG